ncbi:hypothetical protein [Nonomuraea sp. NPDC049607]|uniref:hypothetical protein n=1 Tax=Nonomuraea sp. NPDC049607 TaxID=3154732 RepID=UPI003412908A
MNRIRSRAAGRDDWPGFRAAGAVALFVLFAGGAAGTVLGGRLAGRWGRVPAMRVAYAAAVPAVAGVVLASGPLVGAGAEATTLRTALACLVAFPVLAWLLARTLREPV